MKLRKVKVKQDASAEGWLESACRAASEKKAEDIVILDMHKVSGICDYFTVMSASSTVRAKTIADAIETSMAEHGLALRHRDGWREGVWIVLDFGDLVAHIFQAEARRYYKLERLWGDAPQRHWVPDKS